MHQYHLMVNPNYENNDVEFALNKKSYSGKNCNWQPLNCGLNASLGILDLMIWSLNKVKNDVTALMLDFT